MRCRGFGVVDNLINRLNGLEKRAQARHIAHVYVCLNVYMRMKGKREAQVIQQCQTMRMDHIFIGEYIIV